MSHKIASADPLTIRKYTADSAEYTKVAIIYSCVDDEGYIYYEAVGHWADSVDPGPMLNLQDDSLDWIIQEVKNWL